MKGWIYYCVDNFRDWPGLEGDLLREFEAYLIRRAAVIIAVSEVLAQWIASLGRTSFLLSHGIDLRIWTHPSIRGSPSRYSISRPSVVWWGLIDERLDWDWLTYAAESLSNVHFNLAGRIYFVPPAISRYNNIHFLGQIPAHDLPGLAQSADVLMMPYVDSPVTRAMQPLKMLEYLASGKPIVGRRLPALSRWQDWVLLAHDKYEFVAALRTALVRKPSVEELARRWAYLRAHSWTAKAEQFLEWVRQAGLIN
ncbi:MAG: glycosyltransferase [Gemmatales bacterium]|nr:glycosyltransferase [Gemmatales bacterium]MDW8174196.1 glycosyltransferase [Gemmatales bacterium]